MGEEGKPHASEDPDPGPSRDDPQHILYVVSSLHMPERDAPLVAPGLMAWRGGSERPDPAMLASLGVARCIGQPEAAELLSADGPVDPGAFKVSQRQIEEEASGGGATLALRPAMVLTAGYLVACSHMSLLDALQKLDGADEPIVNALSQRAVARLLSLERETHGVVSDLTPLRAFPREWGWLHWAAAERTTVVGRGHVFDVLRLRPEPRMAFAHGFLTAPECAHLVQVGTKSGALHPSRVVNHDATGDTGVRSTARTSESCKLPAASDAVVRRAMQRAAFLAGLSPQHAEAVQIVHYQPGQEYRPHYDWFSPEDRRYSSKTAVQGNRLVSVFVYLSECAVGGHTGFPLLGTSFAPERGGALIWYNLDRHGLPDDRTLHAGEPVGSGDKWGMNIWLRERARPGTRRAPGTIAADLVPSIRAGGDVVVDVRLRCVHAASSVAPCARCGDPTSPIGLCLCKSNYALVPSVAVRVA